MLNVDWISIFFSKKTELICAFADFFSSVTIFSFFKIVMGHFVFVATLIYLTFGCYFLIMLFQVGAIPLLFSLQPVSAFV